MAIQKHQLPDGFVCVIEQLDADGWSLCEVDIAAEESDAKPMMGELEVSRPFYTLSSISRCSPLEFTSSSIDDRGVTLNFQASSVSLEDDSNTDQDVTITPVKTDIEDGDIFVTLKLRRQVKQIVNSHHAGSRSTDSDSSKSDGEDRGSSEFEEFRDDSVPPFEDTAYLQNLYESCDTFREMSEKIVMDVSGETVRRYMIDGGIHSPDRRTSQPA